MNTGALTLYLLWTLMSGQPVDVDSYIVKDQCEGVLAERRELLKEAYAQTHREELTKYSFVGCQPVEVSVPAAL